MRQILFGNFTSAYGASDTSTTPNIVTVNAETLRDGSLGVFDQDFVLIPSTATKTYAQTNTIYIAQGAPIGKNARISMPIEGSIVSAWRGKSYAATIGDTYIAGYQGTGTLSINFIDGTEYSAKILNMTKGVPPFPNHTSTIKFNVGQTPVSVVTAIVGELNRSVLAAQPGYERFAFSEVLSDLATATAIVQTAVVVNGTSTITFSAAPGALAAGNWVRLGASATTTGIYRVKSVTGAVVELTNPYIDPAQAIGVPIAFATNLTFFGAVNPTTASLAGMKVTTVGAEIYAYGDSNANKTIFLALGGSFIGTPVSRTVAYSEGSGTFFQVDKIEKETIGYYDHLNRIELPYPAEYFAASYAAAGAQPTYDLYNIVFGTEPADKSAQGQARFEKLELIIALPVDAGGAGAGQQTMFQTVLNTWMASVPGGFAAVAL